MKSLFLGEAFDFTAAGANGSVLLADAISRTLLLCSFDASALLVDDVSGPSLHSFDLSGRSLYISQTATAPVLDKAS